MLRRASAALVAGLITTPAVAAPDAQAAFVALKQSHLRARAVWRNAHPTLLTGVHIATRGDDAATRVLDFVTRHRDLLGASDLIVHDVDVRGRRTLVRLHQAHHGLPVADRSMTVTLNEAGAVIRVVNDTVALQQVEAATLDAKAAARKALEHIHGAAARDTPVEARKVVFTSGAHGVEGYIAQVVRGPLDVVEVRINGVDGSVFGIKEHTQW